MATQAQIIKLMTDWLADPSWDIEKTEGFEEHKAKLFIFRLAQENLWRQEQRRNLEDIAAKLGVPGNIRLGGISGGVRKPHR